MNRVLVWKELREQWVVWLALAVATAGAVASLYWLASASPSRDQLLVGLLWLAAWGYGMLCGAVALAGETEEGTQAFLDALPLTRRRLWGVKAATGLGLLALQIAAFVVIGYACTQPWFQTERARTDLVVMLAAGAVGYAWGLSCGTFAGSVLNAVGFAILLQATAVGVIYAVTFLLFWGALPFSARQWAPAVNLVAGLAVTGGVLNRARAYYCGRELAREKLVAPRGKGAVERPWAVLFWLTWRQSRGFALGMALFGLFGVGVMAFLHVGAWLFLTLAAGVVCGVTTFADEQSTNAFRFLGDQRFPLGRVWLVKVFCRLAIGLASIGLTAAGLAAVLWLRAAVLSRPEVQQFQIDASTSLVAVPLSQPFLFFSVWLGYGYAIGLLFGILFHKPLVAGLVALGVAAPVAAVWVPSLVVTAGLAVWQVWGIPTLVLVATRSLLTMRAADRLWSRRALLVTAGAAVAGLVWLAAALWYRVAQIPEPPDVIDVAAFEASLPTPEENPAGRFAEQALRQFAALRDVNVATLSSPRPARLDPRNPDQGAFGAFVARAGSAVHYGFQPGNRPYEKFLDDMVVGEWAKLLRKSAELPTGIVVNPRYAVNNRLTLEVQVAREAVVVLMAHGLLEQSRGQPDALVGEAATTLALARNLTHRTTVASVETSVGVEEYALRGVQTWLERLPNRADVLRDALAVLKRHADAPPMDPEGIREAGLLVALNAFNDPRDLLEGNRRHAVVFWGNGEDVDLLRFSLQVPWEKTRLRRLLDGLSSNDFESRQFAAVHVPPLVFNVAPLPVSFLAGFSTRRGTDPNLRRQAAVRGALLQVALRLYHAETGKPAAGLAALVPKYLPAVPTDPFDGQPFRYRLSRGEDLGWPPHDLASRGNEVPPSIRHVPANCGIVWCVGEDRRDDGGHAQARYSHSTGEKEDVIFVVPPPAAQP